MWINFVQVGPSINGAGILLVARRKPQSTLAYFIIILAEEEHTGTINTMCVSESVNESVSERHSEWDQEIYILLPTCIVYSLLLYKLAFMTHTCQCQCRGSPTYHWLAETPQTNSAQGGDKVSDCHP